SMAFGVGAVRSMNPTCNVLRIRTKQATFSPIVDTANTKIVYLKWNATTIRLARPAEPRLDVAACQLERDVARNGLRLQFGVLRGKANPDNIFIGTDFREDIQGGIDPHPQELEYLATQHFLVGTLTGHDLDGIARIAQYAQDQGQPFVQGQERRDPLMQIAGTRFGRLELP